MDAEKFNHLVRAFKEAEDKDGKPLKMHALAIKDDSLHLHHFRKESKISDVRSLSKTILTLAFGRLMQLAKEGQYPAIDEESYIFPIVKDQVNWTNEENKDRVKEIKIKHLLTHTIGFEKVLMMRGDINRIESEDYLSYILNQPILHEPGDYHLYSNAGFYLLSALMEEFIKEDLTSFLKREFFDFLGIESFTWEKYGKYLAGATRLWLGPEDLVKIAELFLNEGKIDGKEFISNQWLEKMTVKRIDTKGLDPETRVFKRSAYGYGIWLGEEDFFFGQGTAGQRMIILPEKEMIMITLADELEIEALDELIDHFVRNSI